MKRTYTDGLRERIEHPMDKRMTPQDHWFELIGTVLLASVFAGFVFVLMHWGAM